MCFCVTLPLKRSGKIYIYIERERERERETENVTAELL